MVSLRLLTVQPVSQLLEYARNTTRTLISVLTRLTQDNILVWQGNTIIGWTSSIDDQKFSFVISNNEPPTMTFGSTELVCFDYEGDYGLDKLRDAIFVQQDNSSKQSIQVRPDQPMQYCR